ncbi:ABC transporter substrate-binding protein [Qingshengfaniella alkalisoli]|uniref:ABC transporter substrate-binding protein n=1 Tax=Qingshengfaniella alkalisoli TaxID=2599296 RepID=A0A5B8J9X6_9RHOB|nr:ABC transporter substrate-binding protein [Qingshengfaniella alkalisoli]QDY71117.1 ABC transporter substrate-binding protein [Qingshengfaniella alkalisoli]
MRNLALGVAFGAFTLPVAAQAQDCGDVSITEMNWASASIVTTVAKFVLEQGYGCTVSVVPSDTVPAVTSVAENGEPDIVTELWTNSTGEVYARLRDEGKLQEVAPVLEPGGVEGWWIPTYLAEAHPELTTIDGIKANPELVGGRFNNCPDGWGCRVVNDNLIPALDLEGAGLEIFNHGSGETLATSMASAVQDEEPWFGYYWGPTVPLGKFDMTKVDIGEYDEAAHEANQTPDNPDPQPSGFPAAPVVTAVTNDLAEREPEVVEFLGKMTFPTDTISTLLAWQDENNASAEEAAVHFLTGNADLWSGWLNDAAAEKLSGVLQ